MSLTDKIKAIETCKTRHQDWFYHAFFPQTETYSSMFIEGIKCRKLMPRNSEAAKGSVGHNGNHYISLSKMDSVSRHCSSFIYYQDKPAFIIGDIEPKKCSYSPEYSFLERTRWPFRYSSFLDEYQAYRIIEPDKFVGLRCSILDWYKENYVFYLRKLKEIILFMKENNINLAIYDYTRAVNYSIHQIDPNAYLDICDSLLADLSEQKKKIYKK